MQDFKDVIDLSNETLAFLLLSRLHDFFGESESSNAAVLVQIVPILILTVTALVPDSLLHWKIYV